MAAEKSFENKVKKFLTEQGAWFLKYWGGAAYTKAGIPDLLVCLNGHFLGVELKAPRGKASELQLHTLKQIDNAGGFAVLLYPDQFDLFTCFVKNIKLNCRSAYKEIYEELKGRWC